MFNLGEYKATDSTVRFPFGIDFYLHILIDAEHLYDKRFGTRVPFIQFLHLILNSLCEAEEVIFSLEQGIPVHDYPQSQFFRFIVPARIREYIS